MPTAAAAKMLRLRRKTLAGDWPRDRKMIVADRPASVKSCQGWSARILSAKTVSGKL
jgi:hypothetical protein